MDNKLINRMMEYYAGEPKRINHFLKVYAFAKTIGETEGVSEKTQHILNTAAIVHDIGIKVSEEKYGDCNGHHQEVEGPPEARKMLTELGYDGDVIERVCELVGSHHTYTNIVGDDLVMLIEADFLVNVYEDNVTREAGFTAVKKLFRSPSAIKMFGELYK